ncbi:hypothetical protein L596_026533 [Steinernema carpocapsae]|uniref:Uncharacterized protein n=1 Tax=Steinernema carpocapsae TaxID=34508 RepID=A0A4U5M1Q7_STECR|nr:hypothetical protein L596_026533 [Steinernema carpocapsae]
MDLYYAENRLFIFKRPHRHYRFSRSSLLVFSNMFAKAVVGIVLVAFCSSAVSGQAMILPDNGVIELNPLTSLVDNAANILHGAVGGAHGFLGSVGNIAGAPFNLLNGVVPVRGQRLLLVH